MRPRKEKVIMSIDYIILFPIPMPELFGDRLRKYGYTTPSRQIQPTMPDVSRTVRIITSGLMAIRQLVLTHYVPNRLPDFILQAIATEFDVRIYSEHELDSGERVE